MKIKNLLIAALTVVTTVAFSAKANAQVTFKNATPCYYVGVFISHPCPIAGYVCPPNTSGYYYDIPDNYSWTHSGPDLIDQNGNSVPAGAVSGLCLKDLNSGQTYFIDFCTQGMAGSVTFPAPSGCNFGPLNVQWDLTIMPPLVHIF